MTPARRTFGPAAPDEHVGVDADGSLFRGWSLLEIEAVLPRLFAVPPGVPVGTKVVIHRQDQPLPPDPDDGRDFNYNDYGFPVAPREAGR